MTTRAWEKQAEIASFILKLDQEEKKECRQADTS
jgi:hypothetical protein